MIGHGCIVDECWFAGGCRDEHVRCFHVAWAKIERVAALDAGAHEVFDADVGEGAACHDAVVATTRAVGIERRFFHSVFEEVVTGG